MVFADVGQHGPIYRLASCSYLGRQFSASDKPSSIDHSGWYLLPVGPKGYPVSASFVVSSKQAGILWPLLRIFVDHPGLGSMELR